MNKRGNIANLTAPKFTAKPGKAMQTIAIAPPVMTDHAKAVLGLMKKSGTAK